MKNKCSLIACVLIAAVMLTFRLHYSELGNGKPIKLTDWDALGYYMYLPATFIYHDIKKQDWVAEIDKKYGMTGGTFYQAQQVENGNMACKYLGGVAIMQAPFFFIAHFIAKHSNYPADGFSKPYQYSIAFGALLYAFLALLVLRKVLLYFFKDGTVAVTLLLTCLATNYIEYGAIETGQSHGYIFLLYALVLLTTLKWHEQPKLGWALFTGYIIGLATISRPTEAIMLFIPLLWGMQNKEAGREKWQLVKQHKLHIAAIAIGGLIGILPQLIYWKIVTGHFIYDVGSKWLFLNPFFRVLFGWEKGWFIYTPVTILFVIGLFFMKRYPFQKAALTFCLLNIWIIIAWDDWRYGGSYSTRALVQSYPVFSLALAALIDRIELKKWRPVFYAIGLYLIGVNLFQIVQYGKGILHYNDMNRRYYRHIYLNPNPSPIDMSFLDSNEIPANIDFHSQLTIFKSDTPIMVRFQGNEHRLVGENIPVNYGALKIEATINAPNSLWHARLNATLQSGDKIKTAAVRLAQPVGEATHHYAFYLQVPDSFKDSRLKVYITSTDNFEGTVEHLKVSGFGTR